MFTAKDINDHLTDKLNDLQSVLASSPMIGKQIIRNHISRITLTPGENDGKRVLQVSVEFDCGPGKSGVLLNGSVAETAPGLVAGDICRFAQF